jgi:hypothetical protein
MDVGLAEGVGDGELLSLLHATANSRATTAQRDPPQRDLTTVTVVRPPAGRPCSIAAARHGSECGAESLPEVSIVHASSHCPHQRSRRAVTSRSLPRCGFQIQGERTTMQGLGTARWALSCTSGINDRPCTKLGAYLKVPSSR